MSRSNSGVYTVVVLSVFLMSGLHSYAANGLDNGLDNLLARPPELNQEQRKEVLNTIVSVPANEHSLSICPGLSPNGRYIWYELYGPRDAEGDRPDEPQAVVFFDTEEARIVGTVGNIPLEKGLTGRVKEPLWSPTGETVMLQLWIIEENLWVDWIEWDVAQGEMTEESKKDVAEWLKDYASESRYSGFGMYFPDEYPLWSVATGKRYRSERYAHAAGETNAVLKHGFYHPSVRTPPTQVGLRLNNNNESFTVYVNRPSPRDRQDERRGLYLHVFEGQKYLGVLRGPSPISDISYLLYYEDGTPVLSHFVSTGRTGEEWRVSFAGKRVLASYPIGVSETVGILVLADKENEEIVIVRR